MENICIYSHKKECDGATFNNREHIIPAGLGGQKTLPKGSVSDEVNSGFSDSERIALNKGIIGLNRRSVGPGKRGSSKVSKVAHPTVTLFSHDFDGDSKNQNIDVLYAPYRLGFVFYGEIFTIPQIIFPLANDVSLQLPRLLWGNCKQIYNMKFAEFLEDIRNNLVDMEYVAIDFTMSISDKFFILGMYDKKVYIASTQTETQIGNFLKFLKENDLPDGIPTLFPSEGRFISKYCEGDLCINKHNFIHAKTAFNVLSYLKDAEFILQSQFDYSRKCIADNNVTALIEYFSEIPLWLKKWSKKNLPPKSHYVILVGNDGYIVAYVGFYCDYPMKIILSKNYKGGDFKEYFICNFEDNSETNGIIINTELSSPSE